MSVEKTPVGSGKLQRRPSSPQAGGSGRLPHLLAEADTRLKRLKLEAAAARAEARQAELEGLVTRARSGEQRAVQALHDWLIIDQPPESPVADRLSGHSADSDSTQSDSSPRNPPTARSPLPQREPTRESGLDAGRGADLRNEKSQIDAWEQLLPYAESRLSARESESIDEISWSPLAQRELGENVAFAERKTTRETGSEGKEADVPAREPYRLEFDASTHPAETKRRRRFPPWWLSRIGPLAASILLHLLLAILLALVVLKLPPPPAGMALESAQVEPIDEAFELTQPIEASVPEQLNEPNLTENVSLEAVGELAELDAPISRPEDLLSKPKGVAEAAAMAAATAASATSALSATSSFFGAAAGGNCFCYVIDGSGSMRGGPWQAAKQELLKSLASLKSSQRFYIIFFNRRLQAIPEPGQLEPAARALYATSENLQHARRWLDSLTIDVGAPPNKALALAIQKEPDAIYLLTDGVTKVDVAAFLREENRVSDILDGEQVLVPIHAIAFYSLDGQQLLRRIAQENRGQFVYVPDPGSR